MSLDQRAICERRKQIHLGQLPTQIDFTAYTVGVSLNLEISDAVAALPFY